VKTVNLIEKAYNIMISFFSKSWLIPVPAAAVRQTGQALLFLK